MEKAAAHNVKFVGRYHSSDGFPRNLTRDEALEWTAHKIKVVSVWENSAPGDTSEVLAGYNAGVTAAKEARRQQRECGGSGQPIYFAVDFVTRRQNFDRVLRYFEGARHVIGVERLGAYGTYCTVKSLFDCGAIRFGWQTALYERFTGEEPWDRRAQLHQFENTDLTGHENFGVKDATEIPEPGRYLCYDHATYVPYGGWFARL